MSEHDFFAWLQSQKGLDFVQIRENGLEAAADAELVAAGYRAEVPGVSKEKSADFAKRVKQFLVFIEWNAKPDGVSDEDWHAYLQICQDLVNKKQMKKETLELFEKE